MREIFSTSTFALSRLRARLRLATSPRAFRPPSTAIDDDERKPRERVDRASSSRHARTDDDVSRRRRRDTDVVLTRIVIDDFSDVIFSLARARVGVCDDSRLVKTRTSSLDARSRERRFERRSSEFASMSVVSRDGCDRRSNHRIIESSSIVDVVVVDRVDRTIARSVGRANDRVARPRRAIASTASSSIAAHARVPKTRSHGADS